MFRLVDETQEQLLYRWHSVLVNVHYGEFRAAQFRAISRACAAVVADHRQVSSIVFVRGELKLGLDAETRQAAAALVAEWEPFNVGQAMVIEADGFLASVARSVLTSVNLLARSRSRQRVFKTATEGLHWLCDLDGQPPEVPEARPRLTPSLVGLLSELPP